MPRRRSNLGRRTRGAEAVRRVIAKQTEEERASANERNRQRMARMRAEEPAERRAARLEDARLRARRSRSAASALLRSQQNKRDRLRVAERRQRETADQCQTRLCAQQSSDTRSARDATVCTAIESGHANYDVVKYQPAKAMQRHADCFSHGQLHVACSTVGKPDTLYICTDTGTTSTVYSQAL